MEKLEMYHQNSAGKYLYYSYRGTKRKKEEIIEHFSKITCSLMGHFENLQYIFWKIMKINKRVAS